MENKHEFIEINNRKNTEEALCLTNEDWEKLFDTVPDAICIIDSKYRIVRINKAMSERLGLPKEECIGTTCYQAVHGKESPADSCPHTQTLRDGTTHSTEVYEQNLGGWFLVTTSPWTDTTGNVAGSVHVGRDINERKLAEKKAHEEKNKALQYLNIAGVMLIVLDAEGRVILINPKGSEILGYKTKDIIGKNWFDYFLPERLRNTVRGVFSSLMAGDIEPVEYYENPVLAKNGEERIIAFHNTVIRGEDGNIAGVLFSGEDITERTKAEELIKLSEEKYRVVADNTYDWEFWLSPDDRFIYTSPSCNKITGYSAQDFTENQDLLNQLIHPDDLEIFNAHRHMARDLTTAEEIEFRIISSDGSIIWIAHACQPIYDAEGRFIGTRGNNRDITLRKQAEEEKERLIVELRNALDKVKQLSGLLPICASCKKIRDDKGYWIQIESYIRTHSEAQFSHGICPECTKKLYPQYYDKIFEEDKKENDK